MFIWIAGVSAQEPPLSARNTACLYVPIRPAAHRRATWKHARAQSFNTVLSLSLSSTQVVRRWRKRLGIPGPDRPVIDAVEERREERRHAIRAFLCGDAPAAAGGETSTKAVHATAAAQ